MRSSSPSASRSANWRRTGWYGAFERRGMRVIALDQRGHGESEKLYDPQAYARDKLTAVDEATGQTLQGWNPAVNTALGIEALAANGTYIAIGGEFTKVAGVAVQHFARFQE